MNIGHARARGQYLAFASKAVWLNRLGQTGHVAKYGPVNRIGAADLLYYLVGSRTCAYDPLATGMFWAIWAASPIKRKLSRALISLESALGPMKYIVPLFRQDTGRVNLGLVNWNSFQAGFRMILRENRFVGIMWDPWWRERNSEDRRKRRQRAIPERRSHDKRGHRRCAASEVWQPLRLIPDRRMNGERRKGIERRTLPSREKLIGLVPFARGLGKGGPLSDADARLLVRICAALTTRDIFESWKRTSSMIPFFRESDWDEKENHEKFREFAVASFLDLLRPGSVSWKGPSPNTDDMQCVSRIIGIFARASEKAKLQAFRDFLENEISLDDMRKILGGKSLSDRKEALLLVKANHTLKPKEFYRKLHGPLRDLGIELSSKSNSYPKQIERLKKQAQIYLAALSRNSRP